jgi:ankyrin repeat protein
MPSQVLALWLLLVVSVVALDKETQALFYSVLNADNAAAVGEAVRRGADINARYPGNLQTPLMAAVLGGKLKTVEKLLELGADGLVPDKDG